MSDPDFIQPDLCSIRAADEQAEFAGEARALLRADGYRPGSVRYAFGHLDRQRGSGGTRRVARHRGHRPEAGQ